MNDNVHNYVSVTQRNTRRAVSERRDLIDRASTQIARDRRRDIAKGSRYRSLDSQVDEERWFRKNVSTV